ncbi:unnamed protein product [Closterium sp. NIES-54]
MSAYILHFLATSFPHVYLHWLPSSRRFLPLSPPTSCARRPPPPPPLPTTPRSFPTTPPSFPTTPPSFPTTPPSFPTTPPSLPSRSTNGESPQKVRIPPWAKNWSRFHFLSVPSSVRMDGQDSLGDLEEPNLMLDRGR